MKIGKVTSMKENHEIAKKDGTGTYLAHVINYEDETGTPQRQVLMPSVVDSNPTLAAKLGQLQPGITVAFKSVKNAKGFWELADIEFDPAKFVRSTYTPGGGTGRTGGWNAGKSSYDSSGPTAGMVFNKAVDVLLKHSATAPTAEQVHELASKYLTVAIKLAAECKALTPSTTTTTESSAPKPSVFGGKKQEVAKSNPLVDEDVPL